MMKIFSWNNGKGSRLLAEVLGIKRIKHHLSKYKAKEKDVIINWGSTRSLSYDCIILNHPSQVQNVTNKKTFFQKYDPSVATFKVPEYFFDIEAARKWLHEGEGTRTLVARTILSGHEGKGIILCDNFLDIPDAELYTAYVKKKAEYRVHVIDGIAIDVVQKKRRIGAEGDSRIRNTANGYVFARNNIDVPDSVKSSAIDAVKYYGLDFGAVDVIWNDHQQQAYVLEINTAPGIEGTTVQKYKEALEKYK